jgi:hypothetical protein
LAYDNAFPVAHAHAHEAMTPWRPIAPVCTVEAAERVRIKTLSLASRKRLLGRLLAGAALVAVASRPAEAARSPTGRPNVVVIDLARDRGELRDLAAASSRATVRSSLRAQWHRWAKSVGVLPWPIDTKNGGKDRTLPP